MIEEEKETEEATLTEEPQQPAQTQNPLHEQFELPDDAINLVPYLLEQSNKDEKVKKFLFETLPTQVINDVNEDWKSREEWMKKAREKVNFFLGNIKPKVGNFKDAANMHVPVMLKSILQLVCRVFAEIFKQGQPIFAVQASSKQGKEIAEILTQHENWQFRKEIVDFPDQVFVALINFFLHGEFIFESYRDELNNINRHECLSHNEFVYPYARKSSWPDMRDVPRKTRILFPYRRDIERMAREGFYAQIEKVIEEQPGDADDDTSGVPNIIKDAVDKFTGIDPDNNKSDPTYYLLSYHGWTRFPYQKEDMPVNVVVDGRTKIVMGIYSRYIDDPNDRIRFDRENNEYKEYLSNSEKFIQAMNAETQLLVRMQQPDVDPTEAMMVSQMVSSERPVPPIRPVWMQEDGEDGYPKPPKPCRQKVIEKFTRGICINNPEGAYGLGIGTLLDNNQKAANIIANQFTDGATLANEMPMTALMHSSIKLDPGIKRITPGEFHRVTGPSNLRDNIYKFDQFVANPQLLTALQMQVADAQSISSTPDVLSGVKEGDEPFRGSALRVEQAVKQISVLTWKAILAFNNIAINNARMNYYYLPDQQLLDVVDPYTEKAVQIQVGRELYRESNTVIFSADLSFSSRAANVAEADDVLGMLTKAIPPQLFTQIFKGPHIIAAAVRKCFKVRGLYDMAALVMTDDEINAKMEQDRIAAMQMGGMPGGQPSQAPGQPQGKMPAPSIPTGQPNVPPGGKEIVARPQEGIPTQA